MASQKYNFPLTNTIQTIRNIGIIAHIDAGKTTTTERMLFYSGVTKNIGNVDDGDTVMDYLPAERERGITITSAAITFEWNGNKINLIDTPGHADFTFEVIRSIRVLDGAVTILDGVAGVEAQTEKVWNQAAEMAIPRIIFVNKMDRPGAGFSRTVKEVVSKLNTKVALINIPLFETDGTVNSEERFCGVVDVVDKKVIKWQENSDGNDVTVIDITEYPSDTVKEECEKARTALIENLCEFDEGLVETFLELGDYMEVPKADIKRALRQSTISQEITPVLCGASFRNIGVQPLLDAVVELLPTPIERPHPNAIIELSKSKKRTKIGGHKAKAIIRKEITLTPESNKMLTCALAFKVVNDPIRGMLTYVRVYSGILRSGSMFHNTATGTNERAVKLLQMKADESVEVDQIAAGNIGVIVGAKDVRTGDTLVCHSIKKDGIKQLTDNDINLHLRPISVPPPVFFASIEPCTVSDRKGMDEALNILLKEDPSLHLSVDENSGQTLLSGMGELHLDIAADRLINSLKAKVEMGKIMITYKETIQATTATIENSYKMTESVVDGEAPPSGRVKLLIEPLYPDIPETYAGAHLLDNENNYLTIDSTIAHQRHLIISNEDIHHAFITGIIPALASGGKIANLPLRDLHFRVLEWEIPEDVTSTLAISTATRLAAREALDTLAKPGDINGATKAYALLEPVMSVKITINEEDLGTVVQDVSGTRRGNIASLDEEYGTTGVGLNGKEEINYKDLAERTYVPLDMTMYMSKHNVRNNNSRQHVVRASVPLKEMVGYLKSLRSMTQGRGTFAMEFEKWERVSVDRLPGIIAEL
ncbi:ribosome-releasing factor 2, mitochondrial [Nadsonia fulvescens var. elongata DSM 6958]|uniref:Ribosome-releasing factor 2, mitochondrial n=1 Tax=Nadsonia fulvescens var. elongata DSM 6958 TaxID=857566 RepID=A0A1E3PN38_9ASCO|nr:ribosome-releasing factor 2, mitochondrial [Nadsonia fulvescens var. elongata DSM 6958]